MNTFDLPPVPDPGTVRLVMIGDIVGKPGMRIATESISWLREAVHANLVIANAENAADGSGLRCRDYRRLIEHGVDVITLGDHVFRKREIMEVLETQPDIVRPANLPAEAPGRAHAVANLSSGVQVAVISALGRVFMKPVDCPFKAVDRVLSSIDESIRIRLVDFHAEATSDMQLMGRYLDGRVSAVLGTHTHVATADEQILPGGTALQCDVGMTGPFDSILGRKTQAVMESTLCGIPVPFQVATGDVRMNATWIDAESTSGRCRAIGRIDVTESTIKNFREQPKT